MVINGELGRKIEPLVKVKRRWGRDGEEMGKRWAMRWAMRWAWVKCIGLRKCTLKFY
jgi:hypothetical protein